MCLVASSISGLESFNWDGDEIVHRPIVPSSRRVAGLPSKKDYPIDVREFLVTERNEVVGRALREGVRDYIEGIGCDWARFTSRIAGSFDYRASMIESFVAERIAYRSKGLGEPWLFPDETLFVEAGDCEDRAFLLAALLIASGISAYNVRVALGRVELATGDDGPADGRDHVWVMYKNEGGRWTLLEPLRVRKGQGGGARPEARRGHPRVAGARYVPAFLFNDAHLWRVRAEGPGGAVEDLLAREWKKFDPEFAGEVHRNIVIDEALKGLAPPWVVDTLKRNYSAIPFSSHKMDSVDNPFKYDPRDHFDDGLVEEGWARVDERLLAFKEDNHDLDSFAYAAHAIADFYAHSSYVHFADPDPATRYPKPYPEGLTRAPDYGPGSGFDLGSGEFSVNPAYAAAWSDKRSNIPPLWKGAVISGRYAQWTDGHDPIECIVRIPEGIRKAPDFPRRGSLPHHNEIAVDGETRPSSHRLYKDDSAYSEQFRMRRSAAIDHVRQAFAGNWRG